MKRHQGADVTNTRRGHVGGLTAGARLLLAAITIVMTSSSAHAQTLHAPAGSVVVRDSLPVALNAAGTIVGMTTAGRTFLKRRGEPPIDIDLAAGGFGPVAINSSEVVLGHIFSGNGQRAAVWTSQGGHQLIPVPPGVTDDPFSYLLGNDIDDAGNVLMEGLVTYPGAPSGVRRMVPFVRSLTQGWTVQVSCPDSNPACRASVMNRAGALVGATFTSQTMPMVVAVWDAITAKPKTLAWPGNLEGFPHTAINSSGAFTISGTKPPYSFGVWLPQDSVPRLFADSVAGGINDDGIVAGSTIAAGVKRARLWSVQRDLSRGSSIELQISEPYLQSAAVDINNAGMVLVHIQDPQNRQHTVLVEGVSLRD